MALQMAPSSSKALILVGAGLASSIVLNGGQLSAVIAQLQEVLKGVDDQVKISTAGYDSAAIAAQVRQLAQEIRELTLSRPMTIYNESSSRGGLASYLLPAAAIGAMGYCYMRWKDLSFSDVMFATKKNMANAVASVSKQLENVHETLASTKRHLTKRLEGLDLKVEEQKELGQHISNDVASTWGHIPAPLVMEFHGSVDQAVWNPLMWSVFLSNVSKWGSGVGSDVVGNLSGNFLPICCHEGHYN